MPFNYKAQAKFMLANKPKMAKQWAEETTDMKSIPNKNSASKGNPKRSTEYNGGQIYLKEERAK